MAKYFDEQKWAQTIKQHDWYLFLVEDFQKLIKRATGSDGIAQEIKKEVYKFFEDHLAENSVTLGTEGSSWDEEREPIDTIIIHHTKNKPGITLERLSAMHLIRLYASYYAQPTDEADKHIKGRPIYSGHFRNSQQIFYAYHWLVRMDGSIERLLNDNEIGWHAGKWEINKKSIAICLDNDFENSSPTKTVITAIAKIIKENYAHIEKEKVFGHREINKKITCPGNLFLDGWKKDVLSLL